MIGVLPRSVTVSGIQYGIRPDYRSILQILEVFNDPELEQGEKWLTSIYLFYSDFACTEDVDAAVENGFDAQEASDNMLLFIAADSIREKKPEKPTYDWEQDEQLIFAAVNHVAGKELREVPYLHWWTFLGYFNEISDKSSIAYIMNIRDKQNRHKKLEKHERDFARRNRDLVNLRPRKSIEELRKEAEEDAIWDEILGI